MLILLKTGWTEAARLHFVDPLIPDFCRNPEGSSLNLIDTGFETYFVTNGLICSISWRGNSFSSSLGPLVDATQCRNISEVLASVVIKDWTYVSGFHVKNSFILSSVYGSMYGHHEHNVTEFYLYDIYSDHGRKQLRLKGNLSSVTVENHRIESTDKTSILCLGNLKEVNLITYLSSVSKVVDEILQTQTQQVILSVNDGSIRKITWREGYLAPTSFIHVSNPETHYFHTILFYSQYFYFEKLSDKDLSLRYQEFEKYHRFATHLKGCPQDFCVEGKVDAVVKTTFETPFGSKGYIIFREAYFWLSDQLPHVKNPKTTEAKSLSSLNLGFPVDAAFVLFKKLYVIIHETCVRIPSGQFNTSSEYESYPFGAVFLGLPTDQSPEKSEIKSVLVLDEAKVYVFHGCCFYSIFSCKEEGSFGVICKGFSVNLPLTNFPGLPAHSDEVYRDDNNIFVHKDNWIFKVSVVKFSLTQDSQKKASLTRYAFHYLDKRSDKSCSKSDALLHHMALLRDIISKFKNENNSYDEAYILTMKDLHPLVPLQDQYIPGYKPPAEKSFPIFIVVTIILSILAVLSVGGIMFWEYMRRRKQEQANDSTGDTTEAFFTQVKGRKYPELKKQQVYTKAL